MNNYQRFLTILQQARQSADPLLDVCITDTDGSSYRKSGARMLIDKQGNMTGLVTGGCLEGELVSLAPQLLSRLENRVLEYDMRTLDPNQCVMGPGCNGRVRVRLTCLHTGNDYGYLGRLARTYPNRLQLLSAIDDSGDFLIGWSGGVYQQGALPKDSQAVLNEACADPQLRSLEGRHFLLETIIPARRLTILGASADAVVLAAMAEQQGFSVQLQDHRANYLAKANAAGFNAVALGAERVDDVDAIVIMSHDFERDADALRTAIDSRAGYVGLLGPVDRRERLMNKAGLTAVQFGDRLFSPAGLDIGADTSEQIALSILAEMLSELNQKSGTALRQKNGPVHG